MEGSQRILVIDDEANVLQVLVRALRKRGYDVFPFGNAKEAMSAFSKLRPHLVVSDIVMPEMDGIGVLRKVKELDPETNVILITAHASLETALSAMRGGASDYLVKPFKIEELASVVRKALSTKRLVFEDAAREKEFEHRYHFKNLLGSSGKMQDIRKLIARVAGTDSTVLITGESGTGKELVARSIHYNSPRREKPFVSINCAALPETLLESELFGHEKGSFTGAITSKMGLLELANEGTFFFDEIGEIPGQIQAKLLRVLQERELRHVGGLKDIRVNVRVIAASSRELAREVEDKRFREDLYYRLNVVPVHMPTLRERREDIPELIRHFIERCARKQGSGKSLDFDGGAMLFLRDEYAWPGNIRELENFVERVLMLSEKPVVGREDLLKWLDAPRTGARDAVLEETKGEAEGDLKTQTEAFEKNLIEDALRQMGGNKFRAARLLKISRQSLQYKLKKYGMDAQEDSCE